MVKVEAFVRQREVLASHLAIDPGASVVDPQGFVGLAELEPGGIAFQDAAQRCAVARGDRHQPFRVVWRVEHRQLELFVRLVRTRLEGSQRGQFATALFQDAALLQDACATLLFLHVSD